MMDNQDLRLELKAIDTSSLVDKVEMRLIEVFIYKELKPGDAIPKETELATVMGVSRTVIRESLNRLKTMGLIETKKHRGTIIKSPDLSAVLGKSLIPRILDNQTLMDVFEMRLALEIGMADFIFARKTDSDISELEKIVEIEPDHSDNILFDVDHELRFHGKLYQMAGNNTLEEFQNLLLPAFQHVYNIGLIKVKGKRKRYKSHKDLVTILKKGTPDEFREGMRRHLENHFARILASHRTQAE
ncbi:MAG TPA: GntR family transcriptional regulator [Bacteroidales bacterium]|jgi:DNA-binding FadR family transcriptional regulator|nr:FadR family transcriptional regulator [Bacteroidales bacterium]MBP8709341.1 FadR family transcriptional regulator [Bacteroidales bacterium]HNV65812.1 GntR family transcriptional regulator [Bacteroidales bacterium]HNY57827.1 GntR family transcriptional regulator [Bacteroidales bacterium]HOH15325.1 GntR family transcriptional regulator [Bacteroidales bacterium]